MLGRKSNPLLILLQCSALMIPAVVIVLNMAVGFLPKVDNSAHIGGFISGFLLGFIFLMRPQYGYIKPRHIPPGYHAKNKSKQSCCQYFFFLIALILAILGYINLIFLVDVTCSVTILTKFAFSSERDSMVYLADMHMPWLRYT